LYPGNIYFPEILRTGYCIDFLTGFTALGSAAVCLVGKYPLEPLVICVLSFVAFPGASVDRPIRMLPALSLVSVEFCCAEANSAERIRQIAIIYFMVLVLFSMFSKPYVLKNG
jgi:hypothetical protein